MRRSMPGIALVLILALLLPAAALANKGEPPPQPGNGQEQAPPIELQLIAINDFHGNLTDYRNIKVSGVDVSVGGAAVLATHIRELEAQNPNTLVISAGDLIGASPLLSSLFHDEPTIEAMNLIGMDVAVVGNHEFDEGWHELLRMQYGGCHPVDGCQDGDDFLGAQFPYLAANVFVDETGQTLFPAYHIIDVGGARVGFIGAVLEGAPLIVTASATEGLTFTDEAEAINAAVEELRQRNVEFIVVILHEGVSVATGNPLNECNSPSGALIDIASQTDDEVDLFITGHTHANFLCTFDGRTATAASSNGYVYTKIDVELNRVTKEITVLDAENFPNARDGVTPAPDLTALIDEYNVIAAPIANAVIGSVTATITRTANAAGESALGDVIADAQLAATAAPELGGAQIAFMNPGGIRQDILFASSPAGEGDGNVTYGEAFSVQPFSNYVVTMTLTGAQIDTLLETQFLPTVNRRLQVSNGFSYSFSAGAPVGSKVDAATIMLNGVPIDPAGLYRVTVNNYLADGGDGFVVLKQGTDRLMTGMLDLDALVEYFKLYSPVAPGPQNRITRLP